MSSNSTPSADVRDTPALRLVEPPAEAENRHLRAKIEALEARERRRILNLRNRARQWVRHHIILPLETNESDRVRKVPVRTVRAVLSALAGMLGDTGWATATYAQVGERAGYGWRTTQRTIIAAERNGYLQVTRGLRRATRQAPNRYRFRGVEAGMVLAPDCPRGAPPDCPQDVACTYKGAEGSGCADDDERTAGGTKGYDGQHIVVSTTTAGGWARLDMDGVEGVCAVCGMKRPTGRCRGPMPR